MLNQIFGTHRHREIVSRGPNLSITFFQMCESHVDADQEKVDPNQWTSILRHHNAFGIFHLAKSSCAAVAAGENGGRLEECRKCTIAFW
jgi:hypothetical protein